MMDKLQLSAVEISNQGEFSMASEHLIGLRALKDKMVDHFKPMKSASYAAHKAIIAQEKSEIGPVDSEIAEISAKLTAYETRVETAQLEAQAAIDADLGDAAPLVASGPPKLANGLSRRTKYSWLVTDQELVRNEFFIVNSTQIGKLVRKHGKEAERLVGGIEVTEEHFYARG
jgi:hypothetical protein